WELQAGKFGEVGRIARYAHDDLFGRHGAPGGQYSAHAPARDIESQHFAILYDVHAERAGGARVAPHHCIVAGDTRALLQEATEHRKPRLHVQPWNQSLDLL